MEVQFNLTPFSETPLPLFSLIDSFKLGYVCVSHVIYTGKVLSLFIYI